MPGERGVLTLAKVGRRGSLVLPAGERRRALIDEGDQVEVTARDPGIIIVRRVKGLSEVRKSMAGKLPQWTVLEGTADKLAEKEAIGHVESRRKKSSNY